MTQIEKFFNKENLLKHFTFKKFIIGIFCALVTLVIKFSGLSEFILGFFYQSSPSEWVN
jgi:uncharacterized protein (DUF927 family)